MTDVFYQNTGEGQQINAKTIIYKQVRERVEAYALTQEKVEWLRKVQVPTRSVGEAVDALKFGNAVVLTGQRGTGRLTTAVAAITELDATPHRIFLDPEDARRELPANKGEGYIVDIDEQTIQEIAAIGELIPRYVRQLAAIGSHLVVRTTADVWTMLAPRISMRSVPVASPAPIAVFSSHLNHAGDWAQRSEVVAVLEGATPADAARLAAFTNAAITAKSSDPISEATSAYRNWSDELATWFSTHDDVYLRALLLSAASLEPAPAATVFGAADQLIRLVNYERDPGGGLAGSGTSQLITNIEAKITDGIITLPRPAYSTSVLDYVWTDRLDLRSDLKLWLVELPTDPAGARAGYTLIDIAIRHSDSTLITDAAGTWAKEPKTRELAADALTEAGVSATIGSSIRQAMYRWAAKSTTAESLKLTIADVCGGPLGKNFPRNAMTRLRHLARNGDTDVQSRVTMALRSLAGEPHLRASTLREVIRWTGETEPLRSVGIRAFLVLTATDDGLPAELLADRGRSELLADGWHAAVHHARDAARSGYLEWLEAAAQEVIPHDAVTTVLASSCRSSQDIGALSIDAWHWSTADADPAPVSRKEVYDEFMAKAKVRDPLTPGFSPTPAYTILTRPSE